MKNKRIFIPLCTLALTVLVSACGDASQNTGITLSADGVEVNGVAAEYDAGAAVYLEKKVEAHPDVAEENKNVENTVVNITRAGRYTISGAREDTQIVVSAGDKDEVELVLDGADISCKTAPAILVKSAKESGKGGEASVTLRLNDGSENKVSGSHTARINDDDVKYDGAISSAVSLAIEGEGALELNSDNEGIESKMHLTVNDGNIRIISKNDALNASEDGVSVITVNDGYLYCHVDASGEEGDGIDSNGNIVINGGTVISYANATSQDSGLDADGGTTINGGVVLACGNMQDEVNRDSKQVYMQLMFKEVQDADVLNVLTDENGNPVAAFQIPSSYRNVQLSTPELKAGKYKLYRGGTLVADMKDGLASNLTSYSPGEQLSNGGEMELGMGMPPSGMQPPEGFKEGEMPQPPEGMELPEGAEPPQGFKDGERPEMPGKPDGFRGGGKGPGEMRGGFSAEVTDIFEVGDENRMFFNITPAK